MKLRPFLDLLRPGLRLHLQRALVGGIARSYTPDELLDVAETWLLDWALQYGKDYRERFNDDALAFVRQLTLSADCYPPLVVEHA